MPPSSSSSINQSLRQSIQGDYNSTDVITLSRYLFGETNLALASLDLQTWLNKEPDAQHAALDLSTQILALAGDHPFFSEPLANLVIALSQDAARATFSTAFSTQLGDIAQSNWGRLRDARGDDGAALAAEHIRSNAFIADLLARGAATAASKHRITGLDDALFVIVGAIEVPDAQDVDVACAVQYPLHATQTLGEASAHR